MRPPSRPQRRSRRRRLVAGLAAVAVARRRRRWSQLTPPPTGLQRTGPASTPKIHVPRARARPRGGTPSAGEPDGQAEEAQKPKKPADHAAVAAAARRRPWKRQARPRRPSYTPSAGEGPRSPHVMALRNRVHRWQAVPRPRGPAAARGPGRPGGRKTFQPNVLLSVDDGEAQVARKAVTVATGSSATCSARRSGSASTGRRRATYRRHTGFGAAVAGRDREDRRQRPARESAETTEAPEEAAQGLRGAPVEIAEAAPAELADARGGGTERTGARKAEGAPTRSSRRSKGKRTRWHTRKGSARRGTGATPNPNDSA